VRAGQTEGSVDLARLAGLNEAAVICEIINDDGTMARMGDLETFAARHGLGILTIADLISYRLQTEHLVTRLSEGEIVLDRTGTAWHAIVFEAVLEKRQFLALVKGQLEAEHPTLCRMHAGSTLGDVFSSTSGDGAKHLDEAIDAIEQEGSGVIVYLPPQGDLRDDLERLLRRNDPKSAPGASVASVASVASGVAPAATRPHGGTLREYGLGAQVLRELGLCKIRLLTNNPRKVAGIEGYGLELVASVPLISMQRPA